MEFYLLYILYITSLLLLNFFSKDKANVMEVFALITVVLVSGLRNNTGYDYQSYTDSYNNTYNDDAFEFGFVTVMKIMRFFNVSHYYLFFLMSLSTYVFLYLGIKKYTIHTSIALLVYLLIPGLYLNSLSIIRQELAIAIAFYAFCFLTERKFLTYFLLMVLAISFHYSSGLIIFFQLIVWKFSDKIKTWQYYLIIAISLVIAKLNLTSFLTILLSGGKYETYIEGDEVSFLKLLILNGFIIFMLFSYNKLILKNSFNKYIIAFTVLSIVLINTFSSVLVITRIAYYFRIFEIILVGEFIYLFSKRERIFPLVMILMYYLFMFIGSLKNDIAADSYGQPKIIPYNSIFN